MAKINMNEFAKKITLKEGLKHSLGIGDVKEVLKLVCIELSSYDDYIIIKEIRRIAALKKKK